MNHYLIIRDIDIVHVYPRNAASVSKRASNMIITILTVSYYFVICNRRSLCLRIINNRFFFRAFSPQSEIARNRHCCRLRAFSASIKDNKQFRPGFPPLHTIINYKLQIIMHFAYLCVLFMKKRCAKTPIIAAINRWKACISYFFAAIFLQTFMRSLAAQE